MVRKQRIKMIKSYLKRQNTYKESKKKQEI